MSDDPNAVEVAAEALRVALRAVEGVRHAEELGDDVDPPATELGLPDLVFEAYTLDPTTATFPVALVAGMSDRTGRELRQLLPRVTEALGEVRSAVVLRAEPGTFAAGGIELPAYLITVEYAL